MNAPSVLSFGCAFVVSASTACTFLLAADDQCKTDDDCARSTECRTQGRCAVGVTRRCVPTRDEHCAASDNCRDRGECKNRKGICNE